MKDTSYHPCAQTPKMAVSHLIPNKTDSLEKLTRPKDAALWILPHFTPATLITVLLKDSKHVPDSSPCTFWYLHLPWCSPSTCMAQLYFLRLSSNITLSKFSPITTLNVTPFISSPYFVFLYNSYRRLTYYIMFLARL